MYIHIYIPDRRKISVIALYISLCNHHLTASYTSKPRCNLLEIHSTYSTYDHDAGASVRPPIYSSLQSILRSSLLGLRFPPRLLFCRDMERREHWKGGKIGPEARTIRLE